MKNICLVAAMLFFAAVASAQDEANPSEVDRLNKIINIIVEQNDRLKKELDSLKKAYKPLTAPSANSKPTILPSQADIISAIESRMIKVDGGTYTMGCANEKDTSCYYWEKPAHKVTLKDFYMAKYPVTQKEWEAMMSYNPDFKNCPDCPVENITWNEAKQFVEKLAMLSGKSYRLPTEAEWEYAAKGGSNSKGYVYAGSNNIDLVAWYRNNSAKNTHPVGKLAPNELGLYDMTGNVWQWCSDWFDGEYYIHSPERNPLGPDGTSDNYRVVRGGSWWYEAPHCRIVNRDRYPTDAKDDDVGFRLARD